MLFKPYHCFSTLEIRVFGVHSLSSSSIVDLLCLLLKLTPPPLQICPILILRCPLPIFLFFFSVRYRIQDSHRQVFYHWAISPDLVYLLLEIIIFNACNIKKICHIFWLCEMTGDTIFLCLGANFLVLIILVYMIGAKAYLFQGLEPLYWTYLDLCYFFCKKRQVYH